MFERMKNNTTGTGKALIAYADDIVNSAKIVAIFLVIVGALLGLFGGVVGFIIGAVAGGIVGLFYYLNAVNTSRFVKALGEIDINTEISARIACQGLDESAIIAVPQTQEVSTKVDIEQSKNEEEKAKLLLEYRSLLDMGCISEQEFNEKKKEILNI